MSRNVRALRHPLAALLALVCFGLTTATTAEAPSGTVILDTQSHWRRHIAMLTPQMRTTDGALVRLKSLRAATARTLLEFASDPPPREWREVGFDDSGWLRVPGATPLLPAYSYGDFRQQHHFALFCLRGKFEVTDPARAGELTLSASYRGGVVAWLNGKEIGRQHMPKGEVRFDTPALDYPPEAYVEPKGRLLAPSWRSWRAYGKKGKRTPEQEECLRRIRSQTRQLSELKIPPSALRKGTNVLALEFHRAPTDHRYVTKGGGGVRNGKWPQLGFINVRLTAATGSSIRPATARVKGLRVFQPNRLISLVTLDRADPLEPIRPVRLDAVRNGAVSTQVVIDSSDPIEGVSVKVAPLKLEKGGAELPAASTLVRYARADLWAARATATRYLRPVSRHSPRRRLLRFDGLLDRALAKVPADQGGAVLPIVITVQVPKTATPGAYVSKLTVAAAGMKPVVIPVRLDVADFVLPDPRAFASYLGFVQSPRTLAVRYKVPLWSEKHWQLIDKSFRLLGQLGNDLVVVPLVEKTFYGNEQGMVRWVRQADGSFKHDLSVVERYLDTALKHTRPRVVCFCVWEPIHAYRAAGPEGRGLLLNVTVVDDKGRKSGSMPRPKWGSPESVRFWKPVFTALRAMLAKRGLEKTLALGTATQATPGKVVFKDLDAAAPGAGWFALAHQWHTKTNGRPSVVTVGVYGFPVRLRRGGKVKHIWQMPRLYALHARDGLRAGFPPAALHMFIESTMWRGAHGLGNVGADFWGVLEGPRGSRRAVTGGNWGQLSMCGRSVAWILSPGPGGPAATMRFEALREGIQEAEIRVVIEKALADPARCAKLGGALAGRARKELKRRADEFFLAHPAGTESASFIEGFFWYAAIARERTRRLHALAADVAAALKSEQ